MDVSIIIVNYNTKDLVRNCIDSVFKQTSDVSFEVILVDNASTDGSIELLETDNRVKFIKSNQNLGFGRANNLGYKFASGKYIFFLNSDTILVNNAIKLFFDKMESLNGKIGCLGCILQDDQDKPIHSYGDFPTMENLMFDACPYFFKPLGLRPMRMDNPINHSHGESFFQVDYVTGADLFVRKKVIERCGLFDPSFFMYFEDSELQFRYWKAGFLSYIYNAPKIIHLEGKSTKEGDSKQKRLISSNSKIIYLERTQPKWKVWIYKRIVLLCSKFW